MVRGRVVQAETGAPIHGARVTLSVSPAESQTVLTDDDGRYEVRVVVFADDLQRWESSLQ